MNIGRAAATVLTFAALAIFGGAGHAADLEDEAAAIVEATNDYRAELGLAPLTRAASLYRAAQDYADWLAARGERFQEWSHTLDGSTPTERSRVAGYEGCGGENLAYGKATGSIARIGSLAEISMQGWRKSPAHERNLRHQPWRDIGVGVATGEHDGWTHYVAVQVFGDGSAAKRCMNIQG